MVLLRKLFQIGLYTISNMHPEPIAVFVQYSLQWTLICQSNSKDAFHWEMQPALISISHWLAFRWAQIVFWFDSFATFQVLSKPDDISQWFFFMIHILKRFYHYPIYKDPKYGILFSNLTDFFVYYPNPIKIRLIQNLFFRAYIIGSGGKI